LCPKLPTTRSRSSHARDSNLESDTIDGGRSIRRKNQMIWKHLFGDFKRYCAFFVLLLLSIGCCFSSCTGKVIVSEKDLGLIGDMVFFNECGEKLDLIVCWNEGEDFMSLGLGHFIWYQKDKDNRFEESFPRLVNFMREKGRKIPVWLEDMERNGYPWKNRQELLQNLHKEDLAKLRRFLHDTLSLQALFLFERLNDALPKMLKVAPPDACKNVEYQFCRLVNTPGGIYALVDYVNFKGEGVLENESYNEVRWGLLQVLENMHGQDRDISALNEFVLNAKKLLKQRVLNAPAGIDESRWLSGWGRRLDSYVAAFYVFGGG
jgi:hypothetical protein